MTTFDPPSTMRRADGSARYAYVTFLLFNLSHKFVSAALTLAYALRQQGTQADLVCLTTKGAPPELRAALERVYDVVLTVPPIYVPHNRRHERQDRPYLLTRMHALRLGMDGDLGYGYEKIVLLDADMLPLRHFDHLFSLPAPAAVLNERKDHFIEYDADGRYIIPPRVAQEGKWIWHDIYEPLCGHGEPIPREITDYVLCDPSNLGMMTALLVLEPSMAEFHKLVASFEQPMVQYWLGELFDYPDMQYLTLRYSGQWTNVDARFCGFCGYPDMSTLFGTHYAGNIKPWSFQHKGLKKHSRFADFQAWYQVFITMMTEGHPKLQRSQRLYDELQCAYQYI